MAEDVRSKIFPRTSNLYRIRAGLSIRCSYFFTIFFDREGHHYSLDKPCLFAYNNLCIHTNFRRKQGARRPCRRAATKSHRIRRRRECRLSLPTLAALCCVSWDLLPDKVSKRPPKGLRSGNLQGVLAAVFCCILPLSADLIDPRIPQPEQSRIRFHKR